MNSSDGKHAVREEVHERNGPLYEACRAQELERRMEEYLALCRGQEESSASRKGKEGIRFPNAAGFCRYMRTSVSELEQIRTDYPESYERIFTVLEDEALNSELSPTLLSAYLKKRLGYEKERGDGKGADRDGAYLKICFEHDIFEDGA